QPVTDGVLRVHELRVGPAHQGLRARRPGDLPYLAYQVLRLVRTGLQTAHHGDPLGVGPAEGGIAGAVLRFPPGGVGAPAGLDALDPPECGQFGRVRLERAGGHGCVDDDDERRLLVAVEVLPQGRGDLPAG